MSETYVPLEVRQSVANRARHRCEYCHTQEVIVGMPLEIEHIIPEIAGGSSDETNLCLACPRCNRYKGRQTHAVDAATADSVPLFHPRQQQVGRAFCLAAKWTVYCRLDVNRSGNYSGFADEQPIRGALVSSVD
jgi:hypothetical protein